MARMDSVGDVLLAGPAVRAVAHGRRADGGSPNDVVVLCGPQGKSAASLLPQVSDIFAWDGPWISNPAPRLTGRHTEALVNYVRHSRVTEAVILTSFHQSPLPLALLLRLAGVERCECDRTNRRISQFHQSGSHSQRGRNSCGQAAN